MSITGPQPGLEALAQRLEGSLDSGPVLRKLYAADASEYRELPLPVIFPRSEADISELIHFSARYNSD